MSERAPGWENRLNPKLWRDQANPGLVSGRESVRRLPTPRTLPSIRKELGAHLNYRRDMSVNSTESGVNAGHHLAQAGWVRGELKGVIATNVGSRDAVGQALHWEKKKRTEGLAVG